MISELAFRVLEVMAVLGMGCLIAVLVSTVGIVRAAQLVTRAMDLVL